MSARQLSLTIATLMLLSAIFGGLGESYIPGALIASRDAAATAQNVLGHDAMYRFGFAAYMIEALCDVALALLFYQLLRPAGQTLALFTAFLGLVSTATYAMAEGLYLAPGVFLSGQDYLKAFTPEQLNALSLAAFKLSARIGMSFLAMYGLASFLRGWLMYRTGYIPKTIGVLFMFAGAAFIWHSAATIIAPRFTSGYTLATMGIAGIALMMWLFVKGVDPVSYGQRSGAGGTALPA